MCDTGIAGIHLDTMRCTRATRHTRDVSNSPRLRIPPSMLVPSPLHRMQLDRWFPPYPVATGDKWPGDATLGDGFSRRMPVGLLWQYAMVERLWKVDSETSIDPIEAIGRGARELVESDTRSAGLIVPNWIRQSQQQVLLDSLSGSGVQWHLVWRPVAAATQWLSTYPLAPPETRTRMCVGKLAVLHIGFFESEFTIVEIVAEPVSGGVALLPARLRPDRDEGCRAGTVLDSLLCQVAATQGVGIGESSVWKQIWATPWLARELEAMERREQQPRAKCPDWWDPPATRLESRPTQTNISCSGIEWHGESLDEINNWVQRHVRNSGLVEGAVITGELARLWYGTKGRKILERCVRDDRVLVSGSGATDTVLAEGAREQCVRLTKSEPAYLTKLPLLRTVVSRLGEPEWISLLAEDDAYVLGGQKWARPEPVRGIRIPGSKLLKLAVDHEDFDDVREAFINIPDSFTPNQEAQLLVEITPAQGNAKVEVATIPRVRTNSPLTANLQKMEAVRDNENQVLTPKKYLDWCPRVAPPVLPRLASPAHWNQTARGLVVMLLRQPPQTWKTDKMDRIRKELVQKRRQPNDPRNITAIGSDGRVDEYEAEFDALVQGAAMSLTSRDSRHRKAVIRMLAYTSTDAEVVLDYASRIARRGPRDEEEFRLVGNCLRSSQGICDFLLTCTSQHLSSHQVRTIAELASYRSSALELIDSHSMEGLYDVISKEFSQLAKRVSVRLHFRYLTLCVAFLLRRRIFDDSFISPDNTLARRVKATCIDVIRRYEAEQIHIMKGSVDLPAVMRQLIQYVDREGHGAFVLAT